MVVIPNRIKNSVQRFAEILGVSDQIFEFHEGTEAYEAEVGWNEESQAWIINYKNKNVEDFSLAHEVGHIYVAKLYNFDGFAKPMKDEDEPKINWHIAPLFNSLLDGIVNYHISLFDEIYLLSELKYLSYVKDLPDTYSLISKNEDYIEVLEWYIIWFQSLKFIIKERVRVKYKREISQLLSFTRKHLLKFEGGISKNIFKEMEDKLKQFDTVKKSKDPKELLLYFINVLILTELWDTGKIMKQLAFFFPTLRNLFKK